MGAWYARMQTPDGLAVNELSVDLTLEAIAGRVRLGGGLGMVHMWIPRISAPDTITASGVDVLATLTVDVVRTGDAEALYLLARGELDIFGPALGHGSLGAGFRF